MKITYNTLFYKHILKFSSTVFTMLFLFSCDSFTEVDLPQSQLTGTAVFQDIETAKSALSDIYAKMREGGIASGTSLYGTSLMSNYADDMDFYGSNSTVEQFNRHFVLPSNTNLSRLWNTTYNEIYSINALIEGVNASSMITGEDRSRLLGEALFLRAFNYFYLVNLFGDIPYVTSTDYKINSVISKSPIQSVYQNIINDFLQAESLLPDSYPYVERVRANKLVVQAMLARVYLYLENYAQAEIYSSLVINNGIYAVEPNPALLFLKESPSIIWSLHSGIAGQNTKDASGFYFSSGPPSKPSIAVNLFNSFEPGDLRKSLWIEVITNGTGTWYRPNKYQQPFATGESQEYTIILRIEEQYLIRAEARAFTGDNLGAQQDLNITRNRAGLSNTGASTLPELKMAILQERRFEFFTEQSHRWFDLKRTGNAASVLSPIKPGWQNRDVLLPLPENELLLNENLLPQNQGY